MMHEGHPLDLSDMRGGLSRRALLTGLTAGLMSAVALPALAEAPRTSPVPAPRPGRGGAARSGADTPEAAVAPEAPVASANPGARLVAAEAEALVAAAKLGGAVGYLVMEARTGRVLEERNGSMSLPPASVAKTMTTLYALDALGAGYRFATRLLGSGPVQGGVLQGDLILAGGGDPTLDTDRLAGMARALKDRGVTAIAGRFLVWGGALPAIAQIDAGQPDQVAYNPAIGGLNLNYNRVHFEWRRAGSDYQVSMDARSDSYRPEVALARMKVVSREAPLYGFALQDGVESWSVAREALGTSGSRWLPVRQPALYTGQAFRGLAAGFGVTLPGPVVVRTLPKGTLLVEELSEPLSAILQDMLKFSTNMTAEIVGLAASQARGGRPNSLAASARMMTDWLRATHGLQTADFVDHSGLGGASRISAADLVRALAKAAPDGALRGLMRSYAPGKEDVAAGKGVAMQAKTGTLNFVSALAGYAAAPGGPDLIFAILCADAARRDRVPTAERELPAGGSAWTKRARGLQRALVQRWALATVG